MTRAGFIKSITGGLAAKGISGTMNVEPLKPGTYVLSCDQPLTEHDHANIKEVVLADLPKESRLIVLEKGMDLRRI